MKKYILPFLLLSILCSCKPKEAMTNTSSMASKEELTKADKILQKAFNAHGGKKYDSAHYEFVFRKKKYTFQNDGPKYNYTVTYERDGKTNFNQLDNNGLIRKVDGKKVEISEKEYASHYGALNSVIYFATLPHKLYDPAVMTSYKGETTIKGKEYEVIEITFKKEGGGQDHEDEYYYWINKATNQIDYLAYNYLVNNGGVRFRTAYNKRTVDGILFQDYVNYKAEVGTPLADLPGLFEKDGLKKLSVIETESVVNLK